MAIILDKRVHDTGLDIARDTGGGETGTIQDEPQRSALSSTASPFETTRFGILEIEEDLILTLPEGIIGFEGCTQYVVVRHSDSSPFRWLQSLDEPNLAFPVIEPREFWASYAPTIGDADARALELEPSSPVLLFVIVTVPAQNPQAMTANLIAPIVVNGPKRQGKQVIVLDEGYTTRHPLLTEAAQGDGTPVSPEPGVLPAVTTSRAA